VDVSRERHHGADFAAIDVQRRLLATAGRLEHSIPDRTIPSRGQTA